MDHISALRYQNLAAIAVRPDGLLGAQSQAQGVGSALESAAAWIAPSLHEVHATSARQQAIGQQQTCGSPSSEG